jgi:subtilisin family serine protease
MRVLTGRVTAVCVAALIAALVLPAAGAAQSTDEDVIVVLRDSAAEPGDVAAEHARAYGARARMVYGSALKGYAASIRSDRLDDVRRDPRVAYVTPDRPVTAAAQGLPASVNRVDGEISSTRSGDGSGAVNLNVAVLDTGIDLTHLDLNVTGGKDCSGDGRGIDDFDNHGTHVAGSIGMRDNFLGYVGVAPGVKLSSVRVLSDVNTGTIATVICGLDWVARTRTDRQTKNDIAVANMSLGTTGSDDGACGSVNADALHAAICNTTKAGVLIVVAAHNQGRDLATMIPAAYDEVLTVTAMVDYDGRPGGVGSAPAGCAPNGSDDQYAGFSNYATQSADQAHTIAGPGQCVLSSLANGGYGYMWGTSMATPHVTGTAALCIARGLCTGTPASMIRKLVQDAAAQGSPYGFGGDPWRPVFGRYYGYLVRAAAY